MWPLSLGPATILFPASYPMEWVGLLPVPAVAKAAAVCIHAYMEPGALIQSSLQNPSVPVELPTHNLIARLILLYLKLHYELLESVVTLSIVTQEKKEKVSEFHGQKEKIENMNPNELQKNPKRQFFKLRTF